MNAHVPLEACDVQDKEKLAVYRYFRKQWLAMLDGDDEHAISHQITKLLSADLEYRTIVFARTISVQEGFEQNDLFHGFVDLGFVSHQSLAIRRITENYDGSKSKAVYSLPRVISEIKDRVDLITRENYVCVECGKYDWTDGEGWSSWRHKAFDELSGVTPEDRSRDDIIHKDNFDELNARLKSSESVRTYTNKVLAHAADPSTRRHSIKLTVDDFDAVYKDLLWITRQLCSKFLYDTHHYFLPEYNYDALTGFTNPVCPTTRIEDVEQFWAKRYEQLKAIDGAF